MAVSQGWSDRAACRFDGKGKICEIIAETRRHL
jgi:hypothetical protein